MVHKPTRWLSVMVAAVTVVALCVPSIGFAGSVETQAVSRADAWESDDSTTTANVLPATSYHTIHNDDDSDFFMISAEETGTPFVIEMIMTEGDLDWDTQLYVYDLNADGTLNELQAGDDHEYFATYSSGIFFEAPAPGTYYVEATAHSSGYTGSYTLKWNKGIGMRFSGSNRVDTAVEMSKLMFSDANFPADEDGHEYVVVAAADNYPDALAGGALAGLAQYDDYNCPVLLTDPDNLSDATREEIRRLFAYDWYYNEEETTVFILGGANAVSANVMQQIQDIHEVERVERLWGSTRYETAAAAARMADSEFSIGTTAYIASGDGWADALAAGATAAWDGSVLLLTGSASVPATLSSVITDLGITDLVVVGGEMAISSGAYTSLEGLVSGDTTRVAGANRYETARLLAEYAGNTGPQHVLVSGRNYPDGLAAAPLAYQVDGPILLTDTAVLAPSVKTFIDDNGPLVSTSYLIGGSMAVSDAVYDEWRMIYQEH